MPETIHPAPVWTERDERVAEASYAAFLTRRLGFWLHATIVALLVPIVGTTFFGLILLAGIAVMVVAIPVRAIWWHLRYGAVEPRRPELVKARNMILQALALWLAGPITYAVVAWLFRAVYGPLLRR